MGLLYFNPFAYLLVIKKYTANFIAMILFLKGQKYYNLDFLVTPRQACLGSFITLSNLAEEYAMF
jgi:hypothetical protein